MPNSTRNSILIAGLGKNADPRAHPVDKFEEIMADQLQKLKDSDFDAEHISLNPADVAGSIDRLRSVLESKNWDAFSIGFAVRGDKDCTEVFEKAINSFVELHPGKKMMFPTNPCEIATTPLRIFPSGD